MTISFYNQPCKAARHALTIFELDPEKPIIHSIILRQKSHGADEYP